MVSAIFLVLIVAHGYHSILCASEQTTLCVFQGENSCEVCSENYTNISEISEYHERNFTVQICSKNLELNSLLTIQSRYSVTIQGLPSVIKCSEWQSGLYIHDVNQLVMTNITIMACGAAFHNLTWRSATIVSGVLITRCTNVAIEKSNFTRNQGSGLALLNNKETVSVQCSSFEMNGRTGIKSGVNFTAGLYVEVSYSEMTICGEWPDCSVAAQLVHSEHTIQGCTFHGNNVSGHNGGGLSIRSADSSNGLLVIRDCVFIGNSARRGGGLHIELEGGSIGNTLRIETSKFLNNEVV